ncbi:MAG TPA: carbohydrate porin [Cyclobacteriaceae bacterium]
MEHWKVRAAAVMVPKEANGNVMDTNIGDAHSHTLEIEKPNHLGNLKGTVRVLGFYTMAHMGNYNEAINAATPPDITTTRAYGRNKYGRVINIEQSLGDNWGPSHEAVGMMAKMKPGPLPTSIVLFHWVLYKSKDS